VRLFEIGRIFKRDASVAHGDLTVAGIHQPMRIAALAYGPADAAQWGSRERAVDFFDLKGDVEALLAPRKPVFVADQHPAMHPGRCSRVEIGGRTVGFLGELHPRWRQAYELPHSAMIVELELDAVLEAAVPAFEALPRQQAVHRDVAIVVADTVSHDALVACLRDDPSGLIRVAQLFDLYRPAQAVGGIAAGERSMALRLELLDPGATLTDERIDAVVASAVQRAAERLGGRLRS
jgi:phenylalanyl-tRNA synthetase beta chain